MTNLRLTFINKFFLYDIALFQESKELNQHNRKQPKTVWLQFWVVVSIGTTPA